MAFTERYVSVAGAGAHDGTSEANAWTFAEMITAAPSAGTRVNVKAGSYSVGAYTIGTGTVAAPFVIRGYNSTIGDLDNLGRDATGALVTTNMPDITITATWTPGAFSVLQNLDITGALSASLISTSTLDDQTFISCRFINTQNNASARTVSLDQTFLLINCDFECTGASHGNVVLLQGTGNVIACRFKGVSTSALLSIEAGTVNGCCFIGNSGSTNKGVQWSVSSGQMFVMGCTFYKLATAVEYSNAVNSRFPLLMNNHCTDCAKWLDNLYAGTANYGTIELNNRTRDVTTLLTGIETIQAGAVTTDTGGASTDYTNAGSDDLTLISAAPGKGAGMPTNLDIGAYQRAETTGGGGSGIARLVGAGIVN